MSCHKHLLMLVMITSLTTANLSYSGEHADQEKADSPKLIQSTENGAVMLELFTSQGCHSCPPAERWINKFTSHQGLWTDIIPINLHVDYWDYLGWRDPFARSEFSQRQRAYRQHRHTSNVATPGFVVNGQGWNGWFWGRSVPNEPMKNNGKLITRVANSAVDASFSPAAKGYQSPYLHLAILGFGIETEVPRGENAGKRLQHDFVVVGYHKQKMAQRDGLWESSLTQPQVVDVEMEKRALVVWVTERNDPVPIQVAADWL